MGARSITRQIAPLSFRAALEASTIDEEKRSVDVVWTTGARVLRDSPFSDPFYEELSLDPAHVNLGRLNGGAPLLAAHRAEDLSGVIGVVESARIDGKRGVATVRFARAVDD